MIALDCLLGTVLAGAASDAGAYISDPRGWKCFEISDTIIITFEDVLRMNINLRRISRYHSNLE